jgi:hypothetical protein
LRPTRTVPAGQDDFGGAVGVAVTAALSGGGWWLAPDNGVVKTGAAAASAAAAAPVEGWRVAGDVANGRKTFAVLAVARLRLRQLRQIIVFWV